MTRKKKAGLLDAAPVVVAASPAAELATEDPITALSTWLNSLTCTTPFTIADASALHKLVKERITGYSIDVFWTAGESIPTKPIATGVAVAGDVVHVRLDSLDIKWSRVWDLPVV